MDQRGNITFRQVLVRFCAPALAGLKCANMVSCPNTEAINRELDAMARELSDKNIFFRILYQDRERMLVLVYRYRALQDRLADTGCREFLQEFGYESFELEAVFDRLQMRMGADKDRSVPGISAGRYPRFYPKQRTQWSVLRGMESLS